MKLNSILITGASSGIGKACALRIARPGRHLYLNGRNQNALMEIASQCITKGASVKIKNQDVNNRQSMNDWITAIDSLDLVLACAGISENTLSDPKSDDFIYNIIQTNLYGVLNTVLPSISVMKRQPIKQGVRGRIAAISSIAGFISSASAASYCASKAAVDRLMIAMGGSLKNENIFLSSICCGFVKTPMTSKNSFFMPGMVDADQAAYLILKGIARGKRRITFPLWLGSIARFLDLLPPNWTDGLYLQGRKPQSKSFR